MTTTISTETVTNGKSNGPRPTESHSLDEQHVSSPPPPPRWRWFHSVFVLVIVLGGAGSVFWIGWLPRVRQAKQLSEATAKVKSAARTVQIVRPRVEQAIREVSLPGDVRAMEETSIYPRIDGYVKKWYVDIGDEVLDGQLLVEVSTPEVAQQLQQAIAELARTKAMLLKAESEERLAKITYQRYEKLERRNAATQQELDHRLAELQTATATVESAAAAIGADEANVQRLREINSFSRIRAPFAGTITSRAVELGQLVNSGNESGEPLYRLAQTDPVRVFIDVPQVYAASVIKDKEATIRIREDPGQKFQGRVTRTAGALDPATRTLRTEIQVANSQHQLLPGAYVQVRLLLETQSPALILPATAVIFDSQGTRVAVVDSDNRVRFQAVEISREYGTEIGVASGLREDARVISNPNEQLVEGEIVHSTPIEKT